MSYNMIRRGFEFEENLKRQSSSDFEKIQLCSIVLQKMFQLFPDISKCSIPYLSLIFSFRSRAMMSKKNRSRHRNVHTSRKSLFREDTSGLQLSRSSRLFLASIFFIETEDHVRLGDTLRPPLVSPVFRTLELISKPLSSWDIFVTHTIRDVNTGTILFHSTAKTW